MKKLYQQLTDEQKSLIENYKYDALKERAIKTLKNSTNPYYLTVSDAMIVFNILTNDNQPFDAVVYYELFNQNK